MKKSAKVLLYFGWIAECRILYSQAVIQRTIDVSPAFWEHGSAETVQTMIQTSRKLDSFLHEAAQNFKYSRSKIKNKKPIAVDVLFKA